MRERIYVAVLLILALAGIVLSLTESARNPAYKEKPFVQYVLAGIFGLALGFVVQRSRFYFTSAIRDSAMFGVYSIYFALGPEAIGGNVMPLKGGIPTTWHPLVGGILFGFGMVIAGGCVMSTLYRIGEGNVHLVVVRAWRERAANAIQSACINSTERALRSISSGCRSSSGRHFLACVFQLGEKGSRIEKFLNA